MTPRTQSILLWFAGIGGAIVIVQLLRSLLRALGLDLGGLTVIAVVLGAVAVLVAMLVAVRRELRA